MKQIIREQNERSKRLGRIFEMIASEPKSTKQIADALGLNVRTIQRDLNEILAFNGAVKKGRLWSVDKSEFDPNDESQIVLSVLDKMAKNVGAEFYSKAHGLLKGISEGLNHPIFVSLSAEKLEKKDIELIENLESVIASRNEIELLYFSKTHRLSPIKIALFDGFWYLLAMAGEKLKKFHLKSIKEIKILPSKFKIDESLENRIKSANSAWFDPEKSFIVRLWIDKVVKKYFERKPLPNQQIMCENEDGSIEIEVQVTHIMEIKPLVFYYLPHIKVIEPSSLADDILAEMERYIKEIRG
ncbi:helix-turn-helix transcriptional regulator [Campylobacter magnus]|uniref:WYL domain-containing protein n=1 Tax=Campylobacter magnus TaxID=3026462 RepID=A0ABT8T8R0_9BACT|nr:WYL domain-containing protein [Campylobacter magnus]MDO2410114.1 WYL domain-containing protein [Campylobacter magnus]